QFSARTSSLNYKSTLLSQLPLPAPCKRSSAAPIPFGFQLSVARSRRTALPAPARLAPCGFVPLRQSRRNAQRACRIVPAYRHVGYLLPLVLKSVRFGGFAPLYHRPSSHEGKDMGDFVCAAHRRKIRGFPTLKRTLDLGTEKGRLFQNSRPNVGGYTRYFSVRMPENH